VRSSHSVQLTLKSGFMSIIFIFLVLMLIFHDCCIRCGHTEVVLTILNIRLLLGIIITHVVLL